jgi:hypothetical protein
MKYFFSLFLIVSVISLNAQDCKAVLSIETDNELAFVIINDNPPVNGKNTEFQLIPGKYVITVGEASDRWDAKTFCDTIVISDCEKVSRSYSFFRESFLNTEPQDVYVYSADTLIGHTPLLLPPNINNLVLRKEGYEEMKIDPNKYNLNDRIELKPVFIEDKVTFFESPLFFYMSGSLLIFGAVTAYYKLEADEKYAEYQVTGEESLLEETHKLDTISGIAFAALQINFGMLVYFFLSD